MYVQLLFQQLMSNNNIFVLQKWVYQIWPNVIWLPIYFESPLHKKGFDFSKIDGNGGSENIC